MIIIRRIFKDISDLNLSQNIITSSMNEYFFIDLLASIILFLLIFLFRLSSRKKINDIVDNINLMRFIRIKKWISSILVPLIIVLAISHLFSWFSEYLLNESISDIKSINTIFFDELFQILILVDVFLLLFSFFNSDLFHNIMRNSAFIISTILIRVSFMTEGLNNVILIILSVLFGLTIQLIYNECEKRKLF